MGAGPIQFVFDANLAGFVQAAVKAHEKIKDIEGGAAALTKTMGKAATEITKTGRALEDTGNSGAAAFGAAAAARLTSFVTVLGTVEGALGVLRSVYGLINDEIKLLIENQEKAAAAQITLAGAQSAAGRVMAGGGANDAEIKDTFARIKTIAGQVSLPEIAITQAMTQALPAAGGDREKALAAVLRAAQTLPDQPQSIGAYAGGLIDLSKVTGTNDTRVNQGLLGAVAGLSALRDPEKQLKTIPGALVGLHAYGATPQEAGALFGTVSGATVDREGRPTRAGVLSLGKQLSAFFAGGDTSGISFEGEDEEGAGALVSMKAGIAKKLKGKPELKAKYESLLGTKGLTLGQQIGVLQQDPEMAEMFLGGASFQARVAPVMSGLLQRGSPTARAYAANLERMGDEQSMTERGDRMVGARWAGPYEGTAAQKRAWDVTTEGVFLDDLTGGQGGVTREGLEKYLRATGHATETSLLTTAWEVQTRLGTRDPTQIGINLLKQQAAGLEAPFEPRLRGPLGMGGGEVVNVPREPTAAEHERADRDRKMVTLLEGILEATKGARQRELRGVRADDREAQSWSGP